MRRNGPRPFALPPPATTDGATAITPGHGMVGHHSLSDFLSWLPRRVSGVMFGAGGGAGGLTTAGGSYGGRAFYPDESELDLAVGWDFRAASAARRSRIGASMLHHPITGTPIFNAPIDLTGSDDEDDGSVGIAVAAALASDTANDAALAAALADESVGAALDALSDLPRVSISEFERRVRGALTMGVAGSRPIVASQAR